MDVYLRAVLTARTQLGRAAPMLGMLVIRLSALVYRFVHSSGSIRGCYLHLGMEVCAISGAIINVSRCPEKWFVPERKRTAGAFDYWLNSHQIMHVLTLASLVLKFLAVSEDYAYVHGDVQRCTASL